MGYSHVFAQEAAVETYMASLILLGIFILVEAGAMTFLWLIRYHVRSFTFSYDRRAALLLGVFTLGNIVLMLAGLLLVSAFFFAAPS